MPCGKCMLHCMFDECQDVESMYNLFIQLEYSQRQSQSKIKDRLCISGTARGTCIPLTSNF
jgi:hypothetical protein